MQSALEGVQLGHYRIGRLIGSGGMGDVYLARDLMLDRDVAIKVVTASGAGDSALMRRLLHEAKAVAALDHPCICAVHDVGIDSAGHPYMVMQHVAGETLASRLVREPLPVRESLVLAVRIAEALSVAHAKGIVHRDLKPQNVMVTPSGEPRLLDFGLAKVLPSHVSSAETTTALTDSLVLAGTPAYMSPEQIRQEPLDGRSDLFSLGAILYECLTGRRAFDGRLVPEVFGQILQVHPPPPSGLRAGLDDRHDELCRRLLAKAPADRFQSAEEVVGALRMLLPDTSHAQKTREPSAVIELWWRKPLSAWARWSLRTRVVAVLVGLLAIAGLGRWVATSERPVPRDAARWFQRGTEALREGAYHSAAVALEEGIRQFPTYPSAYARLAEARAEIDDEQAAQQALVRLSERVPDLSQLSRDDRLRVDAVRSLVLGDVDAAARAYRELADRHPDDAGAWLDLGRAQEKAALLSDARASYVTALSKDRQYGAGHLRFGIIAAAQGNREESLRSYAEAERLYRAASNTEGETEVLIRRGMLFDRSGDFPKARESLDRALASARSIDSRFQIVRTEIQLSSVTASEGRSADAERLASGALQFAQEAHLDTVAAEALIEIAITIPPSRAAEAETLLQKAAALAEKRGAKRIAARAASQRASLHLSQGRPREALATVQPALEFFKRHKYRQYELTALNIASRAYQRLDDIPKARELAAEVLKEAEATRDDSQVGLALVNLAGPAAVLGSLPEALTLRERAEAVHRRQKDGSLPFDLTNRAELLILLGRFDDAEAALKEVDDGIAKKLDVYVGRQRRVTYLRILSAVASNRQKEAMEIGRGLPPEPTGTDSAAVLGPALIGYAAARVRLHAGADATSARANAPPPALDRERHYWDAALALALGRAEEALRTASAGLEQAARIGNDELQWRLAAVGSLAAQALRRQSDQQDLKGKASEALNRLRASWGAQSQTYERRPDLAELRKAAAI